MATDCSVATVASESACFLCLSDKQLMGLYAYLLCQYNLTVNPSMPCDTATVVAESACFAECLSAKQLLAAGVYLQCQILSAGGGGGGGGFPLVTGVGSPNNVVTPAGLGQRYYDTTGGAFYTAVNLTNTGWRVG